MRRLILLAPLLFLTACLFDKDPEIVRLSGETMGTTFNITAIGEDLDEKALSARVDAALAAVNARMSNWDPNSEVSLFAASDSTDPQPVSPEFAKVIAAANEVHAQSRGMFDVTLGPLIQLWGFGSREPADPIPADDAIAAAMEAIGQARLLSLDENALTLAKGRPDTQVFLAAIAKGYGIDAVAAELAAEGVESYMVEIGGDLVTRGTNAEGLPWSIGIETPEPGAQGQVELVVPVSDLGMATSGDYRNFFTHEGQRYSHIIDPTTGRPITHLTTSVTVLAEDAMMADAWATAMLALGAERGLEVAAANDIAVFFISRGAPGGDETYITSQSAAFTAATAN
ncbi:FAD:protein FMN transferase [Aliiroseovarius sp.]|uniref:FAD:protein FMN transferase n=1 Tax=Aliiroseovarius sp. TaxID=1872442 RepID=UPI00262E549A|nr:FAD:protein FMN transferase [Aliiroseovarius sp.]